MDGHGEMLLLTSCLPLILLPHAHNIQAMGYKTIKSWTATKTIPMQFLSSMCMRPIHTKNLHQDPACRMFMPPGMLA